MRIFILAFVFVCSFLAPVSMGQAPKKETVQFREEFLTAFVFIAQTPKAEQLQAIENNKDGLTESEVLVLKAAFDPNVAEKDFHFYLEDFAGRLLHSSNPFEVDKEALGLIWDQVPWNMYLKGANLLKGRTNFLSVSYGDNVFTKTHRNLGLAVPVVARMLADGTLKVIGKPNERRLDPEQWTIRDGVPLENDRERYLSKLPHHPFHLLSYGSGPNRANKLEKDGVKDGNFVFLSWDATPKDAKKQVSELIWFVANEVGLPAGHELEDGSWKAPTVTEAFASARKTFGPHFDPIVVSDATDKKDEMSAAEAEALFGGNAEAKEEAPTEATSKDDTSAKADTPKVSDSAETDPKKDTPSEDPKKTEDKPKKGVPTPIIWLGWCLGLLVFGGLVWIGVKAVRSKPTRP